MSNLCPVCGFFLNYGGSCDKCRRLAEERMELLKRQTRAAEESARIQTDATQRSARIQPPPIQGTHFPIGGPAQASIFYERAEALIKLGKYPEAAEDYTRALGLAPAANLYRRRGYAYFFADAWKLALRDFSQALELDSNAPGAYTGRGLARVMLGDYREAAEDAHAALRLKPTIPEIMHNIACIFALAVGRASADKSDAVDTELLDGYRDSAHAAVRRTLDMLAPGQRQQFWREKIMPESAFTAIRRDTKFKEMQAEYGR